MKIFNSIKWRLQIWYGLILVFVLVGFGITAYQLERGRQMRRIDDELHRRFNVLADVLRGPPRRPGVNLPPFYRPPPSLMQDDLHGRSQRPPNEFHLPPQFASLFSTNDPNGFCFVIKARNGRVIAREGNLPSLVPGAVRLTDATVEFNTPPDVRPNPSSPRPPTAQKFGEFREFLGGLPSGETIQVGCRITSELKELHHTAMNLTAVGGLILLIGLAGGGWLVSRAIRPIENISTTAAKISAGDLSQRINVTEAESELGKLAAVLNSTFARLDAAFAQQKQFASDAAHELRTPVSVILTQTQTALTRERAAAEYRETVEACQRAAQRMRKLIRALLELARLDAGQEPMKRLRFDLAKTIADCIALTEPLAGEKGVKISADLPPLEIAGDSERLAQVVTNLLTNAIQYNQPGGEVRMKLEPQNGMAVLAISDSGAGISKDDLPRVFERFYRGDKSRTGGGAGLGLAISKAIVEAHGGTIEVSSAEEAGTTFTVRLPI